MSRKAPVRMVCECGCGERAPFHQMEILEIEMARDESLRVTWPARRFYVKKEHYKAFILELQAMKLLEELVRSYIRHKAPTWKKALKFRKVVQLQFVIHSRLKGIEACKRQSLRSGILFVAPNWLGKILTQYWLWSNRNWLVWFWKRGTQTDADSQTQEAPVVAETAAQS